ncbi:MAG: hypothetical protein Kow00128_19260 [Deltaproteobacteria bacterium]
MDGSDAGAGAPADIPATRGTLYRTCMRVPLAGDIIRGSDRDCNEAERAKSPKGVQKRTGDMRGILPSRLSEWYNSDSTE